MSTTESGVTLPDNETETPAPCPAVQATTSSLATWQGYMMFAGLAIVAFSVARGSLAVRNRIYQDKVCVYVRPRLPL